MLALEMKKLRPDELPPLTDLESAAALVYRSMPPTPQYRWPLLDARVGASVWVKHENHSPTGSFKVRGGLVYVDELCRDGDEPATAWSGVLSPSTFKTLVDSPGRKEMARRILAGDSAVWVLVESGTREADAAAGELLTKRLGFIESAAELPPIDPNDPSSRLGPGPDNPTASDLALGSTAIGGFASDSLAEDLRTGPAAS